MCLCVFCSHCYATAHCTCSEKHVWYYYKSSHIKRQRREVWKPTCATVKRKTTILIASHNYDLVVLVCALLQGGDVSEGFEVTLIGTTDSV